MVYGENESNELWIHHKNQSYNLSNVTHLERLEPSCDIPRTRVHFVGGTETTIFASLDYLRESIDEMQERH